MSRSELIPAVIDEPRTFRVAADLASLGQATISLHLRQAAICSRTHHLAGAVAA